MSHAVSDDIILLGLADNLWKTGVIPQATVVDLKTADIQREVSMTVLHIDLDNTLIYSYRHDIGSEKISVEDYQDREISFLTRYTYENLKKIKEKILIVPTSTRSVEQYGRIDLRIGQISFALVCNGGVLLVDGKKDASWYRTSLESIGESLPVLEDARHLLERDIRRKFELRFIENLFLFTKCDCPELVVKELKTALDTDLVDFFYNGEKVYAVPRELSKGKAVERFRKYTGAQRIVAAGDSEFDISMLRAADLRIAPRGYSQKYAVDFSVEEMAGRRIFSDEMTDRIWGMCQDC